jgi:hypothetical protein
LIYIPLVTWGAPRIPAKARPNIIVLVFECLSWLWWLVALATLALFTTATTFIGFKRLARRSSTDFFYDTSNDYYDGSYDGGDSYGDGSSYDGSSPDGTSYDDPADQLFGNLAAASICVKVATALAAINL